MSTDVDRYIAGSDKWPDEMRALRPLLLSAGLDESIKWGKPCFAADDANVAIMQEMKDFLALMFFKGALIEDPDGVLEAQDPNSRSAKGMCFRSVDDVERLAGAVTGCVARAIDAERRGVSAEPAPEPVLAGELQERLDDDPEFRDAFAGLTPGRRREYNLHVSGAKQATTRRSRVDKIVPRVLEGRGLRDR